MGKRLLFLLLFYSMINQSCAALVNGEIQPSQKHRPKEGGPKRKLKVFPLVAGIITTPFFGLGALSLVIDFSTKAIYQPTEKNID